MEHQILVELFKNFPFVIGWTAAIGAGLGALGGLFPKTTTTNTSSNTNSTQDQSAQFQSGGSTTPTFDPATDALRKQLISMQQANLSDDTDLSGYTAGGLQQINQGAAASKLALQQSLAARGLSYSGGPAETQLEVGRFGQSANFMNSIPLLRQQMLQSKLQSALDTFKANPYGTTFQQSGTSGSHATGSSSTQGTSTTKSGGGLGGLFGGLAGAFGSGAFDPSNFSNPGIPGNGGNGWESGGA